MEFKRDLREKHKASKLHTRERKLKKVVKSLKLNKAMSERHRELKRVAD